MVLLSGHILLAYLAWRPAEVERAAALLRSIALGKQIKRVETLQDDLVYADTTHDAFVGFFLCNPSDIDSDDTMEKANEISRRTIKSVGRYGSTVPNKPVGLGSSSHAGKVFYLELNGEGRHPVFHFGMTGMLQVCACAILASHILKKLLSIVSSEERCRCTTERLPGRLPRSGHLDL